MSEMSPLSDAPRIERWPAESGLSCSWRGCGLRFTPHGDGVVIEHISKDGQIRGVRVSDAEMMDVDFPLWKTIKPSYLAIHEEDEPA